MTQILVIGGAGYIGSACVRALCDAGQAVTVYDNLRTGQRDKVDPRATFIEGSILDLETLTSVCTSRQFSAAIHLAALKAVGESEERPEEYFATNVTGTIHVCTALAAARIPHLVFSSTAAVYAPETAALGALVAEDAPTAPVSVYGRTKLLAEQVIAEFVRTKKLRSAVALRYFNVAGDVGLHFVEKSPQNVFPLLARAATTGAPFGIFGDDYPTSDGTCVRDYIHLRDLVDAHIRALSVEMSSTLNLGTETGVSVRELVDAFAAAAGTPLATDVRPRRAGDPAIVVASNTRAREVLGWQPTQTLHDMVRSTLDTYSR